MLLARVSCCCALEIKQMLVFLVEKASERVSGMRGAREPRQWRQDEVVSRRGRAPHRTHQTWQAILLSRASV